MFIWLTRLWLTDASVFTLQMPIPFIEDPADPRYRQVYTATQVVLCTAGLSQQLFSSNWEDEVTGVDPVIQDGVLRLGKISMQAILL